jgi:ketosteroid isomerase-like protein
VSAQPAGVPEVVLRYFELMNGDRWDVFGEVWAEDARHMAVGAGWRQGREAIVEFYARLFRAWAKHDDRPTRFIADGDAFAIEVTFHGRMHDGRELEFDAIDVIDVRDGLIAKLTNWYDIAWLRKELAP